MRDVPTDANAAQNECDTAHASPAPVVRSRAAEVLEKMLITPGITIDDVAEALMVPVRTIEAYRAGHLAVPIERQLLLAAYAIDRTPNYGRLGRQLRGQIRAAIAYAARQTPTHAAPSRRSRR